jgi:hypothetical protein
MKSEDTIRYFIEGTNINCIKKINTLGRLQYIFTSPKGQISMVYFTDYFSKGDNFFEIYCLKGNLGSYERFLFIPIKFIPFNDIERFTEIEDAINRVVKLLRC